VKETLKPPTYKQSEALILHKDRLRACLLKNEPTSGCARRPG
jgi:hypothetical protein